MDNFYLETAAEHSLPDDFFDATVSMKLLHGYGMPKNQQVLKRCFLNYF
jgi:hypothetical protein